MNMYLRRTDGIALWVPRVRTLPGFAWRVFLMINLLAVPPVMAQTVNKVDTARQSSARLDLLTVLQLGQRADIVRGLVEQSESDLESIDTQLPEIRKEIEDLNRKVAAIQLDPKSIAATPGEAGAMEVKFRPPLLRAQAKNTKVILVCENNRVTVCNGVVMFGAVGSDIQFNADLQQARAGDFESEGVVSVPGGSFDMAYEIESDGDRLRIGFWLKRRGDALAETQNEMIREDSALNRALKALDPAADAILIRAYPDSFPVLRDVRDVIRKRGFSINWWAMESGEPLYIRQGGGVTPVE